MSAEAPVLWSRLGRPLARTGLVAFGRLPEVVRRRATRLVGRPFAAGAGGGGAHAGRRLLGGPGYPSGGGVPGGMLGRREAPAGAVVRELREELGLEVEPFGPAATVLDLGAERLDVVFRVRPRWGLAGSGECGVPAVQARSVELAEVGWFRPDELPELHAEAADALAAIADPGRSPWVTNGPQPAGRRQAQ
jgi:8-oxo-dGTP pyrophosphatase MutT (NUDIX family)